MQLLSSFSAVIICFNETLLHTIVKELDSKFYISKCKYHHQLSVLSKERSFTANSGTKAPVLPKGRSSTANSGTKVAILLGMNRCCSFPLLSASYSQFSIWTELKRSGKIPGAPTRRWGEWIWLTGPSELHRNSPQGLSVPSGFLTDRRSGNPNHP